MELIIVFIVAGGLVWLLSSATKTNSASKPNKKMEDQHDA
jgi:hypothetical protein